MFNKLLVIVFIRLLLWIWAGIPKTQFFNLCPFLTLSVGNRPSVSFGTHVPLYLKQTDLEVLRFLTF